MKLNQNKKPPQWAAWLLLRLPHYKDKYSLMDDLEIEYTDLAAERGCVYASFWYVLHVLRAVP